MTHQESLPYAFVARIKAREGKESELRDLMTSAVELANAEDGTEVWFAATTSPDTFWVFDAFATQEARQAHADGEIVKALNANADLLAEDPEILPADILASKLPESRDQPAARAQSTPLTSTRSLKSKSRAVPTTLHLIAKRDLASCLGMAREPLS